MSAGSLRTRLAVRFTALMAAMFLFIGLVAVTLLRRILTAQLDGTLLRLAAIEASAVTDSPDSAVHFHEGIFNAPHSETTTELVRYAEIWRADGSPVVRSQSLGAKDLPTSLDAFAAARNRDVVLVSLNWDGEAIRTLYYPLELVSPAHRSHILQVAAPLRPVADVLVTLERFLAALGAVATALTFIGGWALADRAVRPAREIAEQTEAITAGSLGARIRAHADAREYERLVRVLNDMLARLEGAFQAQRRFVADASHEIRHPLAVLRAALDLARRRERSPEEYRSAIEDGIAQADRVTRVAEGLLLLARADAGVLNPRRESADLGTLVEQACERAALLARVRGIAIEVQGCSILLPLDEGLIGRVLDNLLDNALRFSAPGETVHVHVERELITSDQSIARVHITDSGPGVALEHRGQLFERFFRGDSARATQGGAGLGLAIARGIAEAHGGTVTYTSAEPTGSRFTVTLTV
jgi:two-component system OmpR family sensor kinase